jgi:hypothetical protein
MVRHVPGKLDALIGADNGMLEMGSFDADAFNQALRLDGLVVHVNQLILEGRGTGVNDKNFH